MDKHGITYITVDLAHLEIFRAKVGKGCPPVHGDNPRPLASGLSYVQVDKHKYILEEWQTSWNNSIGNKLLGIKPTIGEYQSVVRNIRREE